MKATGLVFKSRDYIGSAEPPATVLEDESRYGNDGAFLGDGQPNWVRNAAGLWGMDFDGTDDIITIPDSPSLSALPAWTLMCWANPTAAATEGLISKDQNVANQREWDFNYRVTTGRLQANQFSALSANYLVAIGTTDISGSPHLVVATWDGVNATGHINLYVDGVVEALVTDIKQGTGGVAHDSPADVEVGRFVANNDNCFDGSLALPRIYNWVLSAAAIASIFQAERHWFGV